MLLPNGLRLAVAAIVESAAVADDSDSTILYKEIARNSNQSLLWGPYRPNLYFGVRPRIPKSFLGGLMWSRVDNYQDVQNSKFVDFLCAELLVGYWRRGSLQKGGLISGRLQTYMRTGR